MFTPDATKRTGYWNRLVYESEAKAAQELDINFPNGTHQFKREVFSHLYSGYSRDLKDPLPEYAYQSAFWDKMQEWDEFGQLTELCAGEKGLAATAAERICKRVGELVADTKSPDPPQDPDQGGPGDFPSRAQDWTDGALDESAGPNKGVAVLRDEIQKLKDEAKDSENLVQSLLWGNQPGSLNKGDLSKAHTLSRRINIKRFLDLIGRLENYILEKLRSRMDTSGIYLSGVKFGNDYNRLLPSELAQDEDLFWLKVATNSLMQYEFKPPEGEKKGPYVMLIDRSGSMSGQRWETARAIGIATAFLAARQEREAYTYLFDHRVMGPFKMNNINDMLAMLEFEADGGTNYDLALQSALQHVEADCKTDVIMITDGECSVSAPVRNALAASGARLFVGFVDHPVTAYLADIYEKAFNIQTVNKNGILIPVFNYLDEVIG